MLYTLNYNFGCCSFIVFGDSAKVAIIVIIVSAGFAQTTGAANAINNTRKHIQFMIKI